MAYNKHTWTCGEEITAEKLNNLESGVEEAIESPLFLTFTVQMDSTNSEITNVSGNVSGSVVEQALSDGIPVLCDAIVTDSIEGIMISNLSRMEIETGAAYMANFTVFSQSNAFLVSFGIGVINGGYDAVHCTRYDLPI